MQTGRVTIKDVKQWTGVLATLGVLGLAIVALQFVAPLLPRPDFPPFVMTMEQWDKVRVAYSDGRNVGGTAVYRIEYHRRDDWTWTLVRDEIAPQDPGGHGYACRSGTYGYVEAGGKFTATETHSDNCNGVGRWIHYGIASSLPSPWTKEVADGRVTYTLTGERIVFDLTTGLPLIYEAGLTTGSVGHREVFRVER
jgi:hypothetical protein